MIFMKNLQRLNVQKFKFRKIFLEFEIIYSNTLLEFEYSDAVLKFLKHEAKVRAGTCQNGQVNTNNEKKKYGQINKNRGSNKYNT